MGLSSILHRCVIVWLFWMKCGHLRVLEIAVRIVEMPSSKSEPAQSQEAMTSQIDNLIQQLRDATNLTKSLSQSLQNESILNTGARIEFKKDIEHLCGAVAELRKIYSGNGHESLEIRLMKLEQGLKDLCEGHIKENETRVKKSERFWKIVLQNSPVILTWAGLAIWTIIQVILCI